MRIALVTDQWNPSRGGAELYLFRLAEALALSGHDVGVCCRRLGCDPASITVDTVTPCRYPASLRDFSFSRLVERRLRARLPEVILAERPVSCATHYQLHSGIFSRVFQAEREALESPLRRALYRPAGMLNLRRRLLVRLQEDLLGKREGPRVMTLSAQASAMLQQHYGVPRHRIAVLRPGVDLNRFRPGPRTDRPRWRQKLSVDSRALLLLFAAHNFLLKGLAPLLRALSIARAAGLQARLVVVGNGPGSQFGKMAARLGVASDVTFLGSVSQPVLAELLQEADALVHPTFYDSCSLTVLEALACGCPVVTTKQNGAAELIESGRQGVVLQDARQVEAIAGALRLLRDRERRNKMAEEAIRLRPKLDLKIHLEEVVAWLGGGAASARRE